MCEKSIHISPNLKLSYVLYAQSTIIINCFCFQSFLQSIEISNFVNDFVLLAQKLEKQQSFRYKQFSDTYYTAK